jgi:hypothetical protein
MTPFAKAASWAEPIRTIDDERALDVLLAAAPGGEGIRTITKKGIRLDNALFDAPDLGGREGQDVQIRLDDADIGEIFVFTLDGEFVCKAVCPERTGVSRRELAAKRAAHQKAAIRDGKEVLRAAAKQANTETIVADIMAERAGEARKVVAFPQPTTPHTTPDLDEAALAARRPQLMVPDMYQADVEALLRLEERIAADLANPATRTEEDDRLQAMIEADLAQPTNVIKFAETDIDRFRRTMALQKRLDNGERLSQPDYDWLRAYTQSAEYKGRLTLFLEFGAASLEQ